MNLPAPRLVSNEICNQGTTEMPNQKGLSSFIIFLGQFLDHCITITPENQTDLNNISIDIDDVFRPNQGSIHFARSERIKYPNTSFERPENGLSSSIDVTAVYGVDKDRLDFLRDSPSGKGRLKVSNDGLILLPLNSQGLDNFPFDQNNKSGKNRFIAGDGRANENAVLTVFHILFLREHNRLADKFFDEIGCPGLDSKSCDDKIFNLARRFNGLQFQRIVYEEVLPILTGRFPRGNFPYKGYDPSVNPSISVLFSTAAFRFGHSMIPEQIEGRGTNNVLNFRFPLKTLFGRDSTFFSRDETMYDSLLRGSISSFAQEYDTLVVD